MLINDAKPVQAILSFLLSRFSPCSVRMRSVAASGMIRYCTCFVVWCIRDQNAPGCLIWFNHFLFALSVMFTLFSSASGLCDTRWWRLPAHVKSRWIHHTGQNPSAHISSSGKCWCILLLKHAITILSMIDMIYCLKEHDEQECAMDKHKFT